MKTGQEFHFFVPGTIHKSVDVTGDGIDDWIFEGIASTANMDLFGDVVYPESFEKSLEFFREKGVIYYNHNYAKKMTDDMMEAQTPIGRPIEARITSEGLYIKAVLNKEHKLAQKIWKENLTNSDERFRGGIGLSIGAKALGPTRREYSTFHKKYVNILPDLLLYEVSMTPTPVNPETKTWAAQNSFASVVKSLIEEDETGGNQNSVEYVEVKPAEVLHDTVNNLLVVKSVVENEDGTKYVFEQTIDLKEDVRKAMAEDPNKKPAPGQDDSGSGEQKPNTPDKANDESQVPPQEETESPDQGTDQGAEGGNPFDTGTEGGEPAAEGGEPAAEGSAEGEGGAPLDSLFGGGEGGAPGEPGADGAIPGQENPDAAGGQPDGATSLILDKMDTLVDAVTTLVQDIAAQNQADTGGVDSTSTPPSTLNEDVMKSLDSFKEEVKLELSNVTRDNLVTIIKSVMEEVLPDAIQSIVQAKINDSITKSVSKDKEVIKVLQPPVEVASVRHEDGSRTVLKSFNSGVDIDTTVLKSLLEEYNSITGGNYHTQSNKRAQVLLRANEKLGIEDAEFYYYAREYQKGDLKL